MDRGAHPDFSGWVVNYADPGKATILIDPPRRARVTTDLYDGTTVTVDLDVVARAPGFVCVAQPREGREAWLAWIPSRRAVPL